MLASEKLRESFVNGRPESGEEVTHTIDVTICLKELLARYVLQITCKFDLTMELFQRTKGDIAIISFVFHGPLRISFCDVHGNAVRGSAHLIDQTESFARWKP